MRSIKVNLSVTFANVADEVDAERIENFLRDRFVDTDVYGLNPTDYDTWAHTPSAEVTAVDVLDAEDTEDTDEPTDNGPATDTLLVGTLLNEPGDPAPTDAS